jgi:two-component system NtrC family sensor kinase
MDYLAQLLSSEGFMPHGHCYLWTPSLLWLTVVSDGIIALAYLSIPVTLIYFISKRHDLPFNWMFAAFGVFILACGATHVMDIWTTWFPNYWLSAIVKAVTAVASIVTAILLIKLVPAALLIPSRHQLDKVKDELVVASRYAGMAEVATDVLHNIGNVLNSVNLTANLLASQMRGSQSRDLGRAVQLLDEHKADLGDYLTHDEKGKLLPQYLRTLDQALAAEREQMLGELEQLTKNIEHIKDIVATQQSYAGVSSVIEPTQVLELMEDALRLNAGSLTRHEVTVVKEFADVPELPLDRHRVLQILVNLINNAKQAMDSVAAGRRRLVLRVGLAQAEAGRKLQVCVADEGEGIAAENLTRIFSHGFTTRKKGHGFGLHSCALAARQMGGTLTAYSEGLGKGASFTLELPIDTPQGAA